MSPEMMLLCALSALNLLLLIVISYIGLRSLDDAIEELDARVAGALKALVENFTGGGFEGFEPPNPIQNAIGQLIQAWAQQQTQVIPAQVVERNESGQFATKDNKRDSAP